MSYEMYGDYNRGDEEEVGIPEPYWWEKAIKWGFRILCAVLCLSVIFTLIFRLFLGAYYPRSMKRLYYTDALTAYAEGGGDMSALTQNIRVPFESEILEVEGEGTTLKDHDKGYYRADNLILISGCGALQFSLRTNVQNMDDIATEYGVASLEMGYETFLYVLRDDQNRVYFPSQIIIESSPFYHYVKLCFDGVVTEDVAWMRVEIIPRVASGTGNWLAICVYENHEGYAKFEDYRLRGSERWEKQK